VWCYKTTKEELDRIDRKYTQLLVDQFVLDQISSVKGKPREVLDQNIKDFKNYMSQKEDQFRREKFADPQRNFVSKNYTYLSHRLAAIEKAICYFLSKKELERIEELYEQEMTTRILQAREHT
jgi:hypothetical protein